MYLRCSGTTYEKKRKKKKKEENNARRRAINNDERKEGVILSRAILGWRESVLSFLENGRIKWRNDVSGKWRETIELLDGNPKNVSDFGWTCSPLSLLRPVYPRGG